MPMSISWPVGLQALIAGRLSVCGMLLGGVLLAGATDATAAPSADLSARIAHHARGNGVPPALAMAIIRQESGFNPRAAHRGNLGLMQIRLQTARGVGYRGDARGLLNLETNLTYGMRYLARAHREARGDTCRTIQRYQTGRIAPRIPAATLGYCSRAKRYMAGLR